MESENSKNLTVRLSYFDSHNNIIQLKISYGKRESNLSSKELAHDSNSFELVSFVLDA